MSANPIDLTTTSLVRGWLSINSGLPNNASQTAIVSTTIAVSITPGTQTVSPASIVNIVPQMVLSIDTGTSQENVVVTTVGASTFTASFALAHTGPGIQVLDMTDVLIGRLITSASNYILWRSGRGPNDGSIAAASPFVTPIAYNENYDGNGNYRLFLRNYPIVSVTSLMINGVSIQSSGGQFTQPGYIIDSSGKSLVFMNSGQSAGGQWFPRGYSAFPFNYSALYCFTQGTQNINVQYTAGYSQTPWDLQDACTKLVGWNFQAKRDAYGVKQVVRGGESTTYESSWICPPDVDEVIRFYSRRSTN